MAVNIYNVPSVEAQFKNFLTAGNISSVSMRNYLSDFRYFLGWMRQNQLLSSENWISKVNLPLINNYKTYLTSSKIPLQTVNRRLSGLRKFCEYLMSVGILKENIATGFSNAGSSLKRKYLSDQLSGEVLSEFRYDLLLEMDQNQVDYLTGNINELLQFTRHK